MVSYFSSVVEMGPFLGETVPFLGESVSSQEVAELFSEDSQIFQEAGVLFLADVHPSQGEVDPFLVAILLVIGLLPDVEATDPSLGGDQFSEAGVVLF